MKSALLSTAAAPLRYNEDGLFRVQKAAAEAIASGSFADAEDKEEGEESKRFSALMDMIADACSKMDEGSKRMDARMDSFEERLGKAAADSAKKDEDETEAEKKARADAEGETEEEKKAKADKTRKDEDDMAADKGRKDAEEKEEKAEADKARKDAEETEAKEKAEKEEKEKAEADSASATRAELAELRGQITALTGRVPQMISDSDRERFASIQEKAEPVFQAFGDRAPAPLEGETTLQYKRRLGSKMQGHSTQWKDKRLSAIADEGILDVAVDQIYADAITLGRRGADVAAGNLRANRTTTPAGHTRIEYFGDTKVLTGMFSGQLQRA